VVDIAKLAFVTGLTFWLGNIVVLSICLLVVPDAATAVDRLPPDVNRALGALGLATLAGYLLWLAPRPRVIGRNGWTITLPTLRLTALQLGIGVLDLAVTSLAFYILLPASPAIDFMTLMVIFVTATLLGFISHAPGSLGVFEAAILIAMPQFEKEELLATLLIFRGLYFVLPLMIATSAMMLRELSSIARK
jgi:glycosyltransferase 2 family protein